MSFPRTSKLMWTRSVTSCPAAAGIIPVPRLRSLISTFLHHCCIVFIPLKMSLNVLVTGASGLLGRQVFNTFKHSGCLTVGQGFTRATPPTILKADLEKSEDVKTILDEAKWVIIDNWQLDICSNSVADTFKRQASDCHSLYVELLGVAVAEFLLTQI